MHNNSTMDKQNGHHYKKSAVLYDVGGGFLMGMFFGVVFIGVVLDYLWNYLVLSVTLRWRHINIPRKEKAIYCVIITAFGLLIDWLYYEFAWGTLVLGSLVVPAIFPNPGTQPGLEIITILIPVVLIGVVNYSASRLYLHTDVKSSLVVGVTMAVFTAPWLILAFVLLNWRP